MSLICLAAFVLSASFRCWMDWGLRRRTATRHRDHQPEEALTWGRSGESTRGCVYDGPTNEVPCGPDGQATQGCPGCPVSGRYRASIGSRYLTLVPIPRSAVRVFCSSHLNLRAKMPLAPTPPNNSKRGPSNPPTLCLVPLTRSLALSVSPSNPVLIPHPLLLNPPSPSSSSSARRCFPFSCNNPIVTFFQFPPEAPSLRPRVPSIDPHSNRVSVRDGTSPCVSRNRQTRNKRDPSKNPSRGLRSSPFAQPYQNERSSRDPIHPSHSLDPGQRVS